MFVAIPSRRRRGGLLCYCYNDKIPANYTGFSCRCEEGKTCAMSTQLPYYRIYLLIVWQERSGDRSASIAWRFRLEDPRTGRQQMFADVATFMAALQEIAAELKTAEKQEKREE